MTHPAGPSPESLRTGSEPGSWPAQPPTPAWPPAAPPPQQAGWGAYPPPPAPPVPAPRQDSTRVLAIVALVVSVLTLLAVGAMQLVPLLVFGVLGSVAGEGFDEGMGDPVGTSSVTTYTGGEVPLAADGSVSAPALAGAVVEIVSTDAYDGMAERTSCDPVPHAVKDVSVLCRASDPGWYGIVRFTDDEGSFQVFGIGDTEGSIP